MNIFRYIVPLLLLAPLAFCKPLHIKGKDGKYVNVGKIKAQAALKDEITARKALEDRVKKLEDQK